ncbi:hypothetical protein AYO21_00785 [Fonsecaea monophora]|uniref:Uncharacterized protein n=1 Tax=Fonsecaea monophora TaxID=254056 RepID=A0A177FKJ8_9EURO|nr:hypothetical protein AYO21_00785 [Fonsecaea monophora]KAH0844311.1 hypothetical protein FOPE_09976 [Fonsecaea pedrosoi]OAG44824.1 hypothetical protein AYO21_00785 [Fonsecaea monophora]
MGFNPWVPNRRQRAGYMAMIAENGNFGDMFWASSVRIRHHNRSRNRIRENGLGPGAEPDTWSLDNHAGSDVGDVVGLKREIKQEEGKEIKKEEVKIEVKREDGDDEEKQKQVLVKEEDTNTDMDMDDVAVKIKIKVEAEEEEKR